ncbi:MAG: hypothetical protein MJ188_06570 [Treponema sp.]|nr:hypothetical protein [Treponema sp.]
MAENKPNNFQDIHIEDYLVEYENKQITAESFLFDYNREKQSLNGPWNYAVDQYDTCLRQKWFNEYYKDSQGLTLPVDFSFDEWPTMPLPCCWNTFAPEYLLYEGVMVFSKKFDYEKSLHHGKRVFLKIGAINYTSRLFLNKNYLGVHRGGSTPFYIEITQFLQNENRLIIVADSTRRPEQVPTENTDWFNYGGVYRDIELIFVPETFIQNFNVSLKKDNTFKNIHAKINLSAKIDGTALLSISELNVKQDIAIKNGCGELDFTINNLKLWDIENPKLYTVELSFGEDKISDEIGFRQIHVEGKQIFLNGKPIFLKGISCHEESVPNGKALTDEERIQNISIAKEMGCNFMRLAHYPHHENTARLADKMGLLLWEEVPVYWAIKFNRNATYNDAENQLKELLLRDMNRASVIIWSVGNENLDSDDRLNFMSRLAQTAHQMDNSRLVSAACLVDQENNRIADRLAQYLDVIGINEYYGWYNPDFNRLPQMLNNSNPDKPVIITEFGADAMPELHGDSTEKGNEEFQEWVYQKQTETLNEISYVQGMTPWILYDFRCPRRTSSIQKYYNRKGLLSPDKTHRKKAFHILQNYYLSKNE